MHKLCSIRMHSSVVALIEAAPALVGTTARAASSPALPLWNFNQGLYMLMLCLILSIVYNLGHNSLDWFRSVLVCLYIPRAGGARGGGGGGGVLPGVPPARSAINVPSMACP